MIEDARQRRLALLVLLAGVGVAGWLTLLPHLLPSRYPAAHWRAAWVGLDTVEAAALLATAFAARRGRPAAVPAAVATTALVLDAWFDVCTASSTGDVIVAAALAALGEVPLAAAVVALASGRLGCGRPALGRPREHPPAEGTASARTGAATGAAVRAGGPRA